MKTLVAGGAGYIGSHMVRVLADAGHDVAVFDDFSTGHEAAIPKGVTVLRGSLLDAASVETAFGRARPEAVLHFAALSIVPDSVRDPATYYRANLTGALNLLDAMRRHGADWLVFSSTASVYGMPERVPIAENHPLRPISPYGWSKLFIERMIEDYCAAYGLRAASLRYFNAAGAHPSGEIGEAHDPETHLIPNVLRAAADGGTLAIYGDRHPTADGFCVRDYIHVMDLCDAHLRTLDWLAEADRGCFGVFNLGSGRGFSVMEVLRAAERVVGKPIPNRVAAARAGDPPALVAASQFARDTLRWTPQHDSLEAMLETAWRWHRNPRF